MWFQLFALLFFWVLRYQIVTGIIGGKFANPPQPDAAVIFTQKYGRNARIEGVKNDARGYYTFLGIRYAEAPLGASRFRRANLARLEGEVNATGVCAPCAQPHPENPNQLLGSEDCLCLNVYTPKMPGSEKGSPVIFWIHGGGFRQGSASYYGGEHFAQKDTILVSVQYRLGSLGFLSYGNREMSGNVGMLDLSTALQWVLDYIEFFGGDPARVVTMGQGSGGTAASLLALSPMSRAGVSGVAALSGAPLAPAALEHAPKERAYNIAAQTKCPQRPPSALADCLRTIPVDQIVKVDSDISLSNYEKDSAKEFISQASGNTGTGVSVEGVEDERSLPPLVEVTPASSMEIGEQRVPLLTGVVRDETARAVFGENVKGLTEKLLNVPNFILNEIINPAKSQLVDLVPKQLLQNNIPRNALKLLNFESYYNFISKKTANVTQGLLKIVEATSDAFFNYPAFASVDKWSKRAPAYLYSFEYRGKKIKGSHFLRGMPIVSSVSSQAQDNFVAHGDELAYLFEPLDIDGNPISTTESTSSDEDDHVRNIFTDLIVNFVHNVSLTKGKDDYVFNKDTNKFLQIGSNINIVNKFRFCQMALWGNLEQQLQDATCSVLGAVEDQIGTIISSGDVLSGVDSGISNVGGLFKEPFQPKPMRGSSDNVGISDVSSLLSNPFSKHNRKPFGFN